ncbi:RICIN domain-containing protein [Streptomyces sp. NPDC053048]|uniref:RICIN domain-containing protein n=1 Tax=Streptomyces sp. NPDC053048 TaxID=3365694 RepID=UPI0037D7D9F8
MNFRIIKKWHASIVAMTVLAATVLIFSSGAASAAVESPVGDGQYHAISNVSGLVLEREGRCANQTGYAIINTAGGFAAQQYRFDLNSEGTVYIYDRCALSRALTAPPSAGGKVELRTYDSSRADQKWNVTQDPSGKLTIASVAGGFVLDSAGVVAGSFVVANTADPQSPTQKWAVVS